MCKILRESSNEYWVWRTQATQALVIYVMEEQDVCVPTYMYSIFYFIQWVNVVFGLNKLLLIVLKV